MQHVGTPDGGGHGGIVVASGAAAQWSVTAVIPAIAGLSIGQRARRPRLMEL